MKDCLIIRPSSKIKDSIDLDFFPVNKNEAPLKILELDGDFIFITIDDMKEFFHYIENTKEIQTLFNISEIFKITINGFGHISYISFITFHSGIVYLSTTKSFDENTPAIIKKYEEKYG